VEVISHNVALADDYQLIVRPARLQELSSAILFSV